MSEILSSTFVLAVNDLETSKRFYLDKLGFAEDFSVEGWAFLSRGGCHLRLGHCPDAMPMSKAQDHSWFAYLHVRDASGLYEETVKNGVEIWHKLADKPWGMREFAIVTELCLVKDCLFSRMQPPKAKKHKLALQRTRHEHRDCNSRFPCAGSLGFVRWTILI
jgi:uncharacterized glyoxalase superfamily protein PhnB